MRVTISCINSKYVHSSLAPWYLKSAMERYSVGSHRLTVHEGTINQSLDDLYRDLIGEEADVIGFCCYIWNIHTVLPLAERIKASFPAVKIVLGGPEVSFRAEDIVKQYPFVDAVICGEGERAFPQLVDSYVEGTVPAIPGLCLRMPDGGVRSYPPAPITEIPPSPYCEEYFSRLGGRIAYLETSRGCPFSCGFCLSGRENPVRFFPIERGKKELLLLANSGASTVKLVDRTFNCDPIRAGELWAFLMDEYGKGYPKGVRFHFEIGADLLTEENLALLSRAPKGLFQMEAGIQSFHGETLAAVSRKTDVDRLENNLKRLIDGGNIHVHVDLIAGLPGEGYDAFAASFDRAFALRPHQLQLGFLKLLYGTPLRSNAEKWGCVYSHHAPYEVLRTETLTEEELLRLHRVEDAVERLYNCGRFTRTVESLLKKTPFSPFYLFEWLGEAIRAEAGLSLSDYIQRLLDVIGASGYITAEEARDLISMDYAESVFRGKLPNCLRVEDPRLARLKTELGERGKHCGILLLYHGGVRAYVVDYGNKDPITGRYHGEEIPLTMGNE